LHTDDIVVSCCRISDCGSKGGEEQWQTLKKLGDS